MADVTQGAWIQNSSRRLDVSCLSPVDTETLHGVLLPSTHCMSRRKRIFTHRLINIQNGLQRYRTRIRIAIASIIITFLGVFLTIYLSCRPFHHYWQINPNPGNVCQAGISMPIIWVSFVSNVSTDVYLLFIPIPMLWASSLKLLKKLATTMLLSAGLLIIICAILKSIYVIVVRTM
jgi:hypothetical protein